MIAARGGPNIFELDAHASTQEAPYFIYTADDHPKEIDDGIAVEPLPTAQEAYRVHVCVADTSSAYLRDDIVRQAQVLVEARYLSPQHGQGYTPLLPPDFIRGHELKADGRTKSALIVDFVVGKNCPPTDVNIKFGAVEAVKNLSYRRFGQKCRYSPEKIPIARAAILTKQQLRMSWRDDEAKLIHVPSSELAGSGSSITSTFMISACHLAGKYLKERGLMAIYRIHDPADDRLNEFLDGSVAHFSLSPGPHVNLGIDPYCRVTSPLRRLEDFVMCGLLKAYTTGRPIGTRDEKVALETVRALNQRIAQEQRQSRKNQTENWVATSLARQLVAQEQTA